MNNIELLKYIHKYTIKHGYPPTMREIAHHFKTHHIIICDICTELKKQRYLKDIRKKARSLVLTEKALNEIGYPIPGVHSFNEESYVRLSEYQELQNRLSKRICELQSDLGRMKDGIQ